MILTGAGVAISDHLVGDAAASRYEQTVLSTVKGLGVVLLTGMLLHLVIRRAFARVRGAVERMTERDALLRGFAEMIPDPLFVKDLASRWIYANPAALAVVNRSAGETFGKTDRELYDDPEIATRLIDADRKVIESGRSMMLHERVQTPAGERIYLSTKAPWRGQDGRIIGVIGTARDVTEQAKVAEALRVSEGRLRLFVEHAPAAIAMLDREMRYLAVSRRWLEDYRLGDVPVIGRSHYEIFPDIPERWREIHRRCLAGAVERCEEDPFPRADGTLDWVRWEIRPWCEASGEVAGLVIFSEVITARIEAEKAVVAEKERAAKAAQALREGDARRRALLEHATDILIVLDDDARITFWSPGAAQALGYEPTDAVGARLPDLLLPEDLGAALSDFGRLRGIPGGKIEVNRRLRHRNGSTRLVEAVAWNLLDDPAVHGIVVNMRDITEQRRAQDALAQAQKLESIGRLAGGVAHDFNNILTVILSATEGLRADVADGKVPLIEDVEEIHAAGERAEDLTRQLLAFARKQAICPAPNDLCAIARGMERLLRRVLGEDIALKVQLEPAPWTVFVDRGQLEQVILNLAVNARDAMPQGGTLTIRTANVPAEPAGEGPRVALHVIDDGAGMEAEVRAHLFEPFFTTKAAGKGTGLGLATVYGIVRQSGGTIDVESAPARGTTFAIQFPRYDGELLVAPAPPPRRRSAGGHETVLVLEDEPNVREVAVRALRQHGYRVLVCESGGDALALVDRGAERPQLLVADVVLAGMDGPSVAGALRARVPGLRVLFVSGYSQDVIEDHGVTADTFLQKPFTVSGLLERVRLSLDAPSRPAAVAAPVEAAGSRSRS